MQRPQRRWLTNKRTRIPSGTHIQDLDYVYDNVGNITRIKQYAGTWSSLGGSYTNDYIYDHQYRLISATETSSPTFNVNFSASYSPAGRLGHDFCSSNNMNKQLTYGYDRSGDTHQPRVIFDAKPRLPYDLYWDANGNLAQVIQCDYNEVRFHEWDDNNRLRAVIGPNQVGFYGYDGNGVRVWKLTGLCQIDNQNGGEMSYSALLDDAVLYPNPYLTITPAGYTKHYYIGSERIATAIGEGGWGNALVNKDQHDAEISTAFFRRYENDLPCEQYKQTINYDIAGEYREEIQYNCKPKCLRYLKLNYAYDYLANCINTYSKTLNQEKTFFTHSDHLGSASWITYSGGYPVQYIHYAPYGELMANQKTSSFDERYKFTGKERDTETGYDNFGARYLLSDAGIWLSVDPLADKYIHLSPYMYCNGNPIKYIDPDGKEKNIFLKYKRDSYAAQNLPDDNGIYIFGHGNFSSISNTQENESSTTKYNASALAEYIQQFSDQWRKDVEGNTSSIIFLYACNTGEGENNLAQQLSANLSEYGAYVVAPMGTLTSFKDPRKPQSDRYGKVIKNGGVGSWGVYKNGKLVTTISGRVRPNPKIVALRMQIMRLWESVKKFFTHNDSEG